jgi:HSP20 family protein
MKGSWAERSPKVDVADSDKEVVIKAELPGVGKDDLDVSLTDAGIRISAKTHAEKEIKDDDYVRREISHGEFSRVIALPAAVDSDKAEASFKDGVLTVKLPKMESSQRRPIKVS